MYFVRKSFFTYLNFRSARTIALSLNLMLNMEFTPELADTSSLLHQKTSSILKLQVEWAIIKTANENGWIDYLIEKVTFWAPTIRNRRENEIDSSLCGMY